jgi:phosphatidylserine decarboxylase
LRLYIHREGWRYIAIAVVLNLAFLLVSNWLALAFLPITIWCIAFFRDPDRTPPSDAGIIVSPADGRLLPIVTATPPAELGMGGTPLTRLSIFMNVFDVHVNRIPCDGTVETMSYRPGKFINASFDKASEDNERMSIRLKTAFGTVALVQIAGLVARRIKCDLADGQEVHRAARFGIIRFGSRVDLYLPAGIEISARSGDRVTAGETPLARFRG